MASKVHVIGHSGAKGVFQPELVTHGLDHITVDRASLRTTAVRGGGRLSIQSDLGTSDTHVVGIHVSGLSATVIYTDTHRSRAAFLQQVLEPYEIRSRTNPASAVTRYEIRSSRYTCEPRSDLEEYLKFFGSRIVFLIDRNCARKRLERFVKRADAAVLLKWTADNTVGQCAFLQEGDAHLISTAVERTKPTQIRLGVRLDELLACDSARSFLMRVLAIVSTGLTTHQPLRLINDDIEAALLKYLESTDQAVLTAASDHAMLVSSLLDRIHAALVRLTGDTREDARGTSRVEHVWEKRASEIARRSSRLLEHTNHHHRLHRLLTEAGAVTEALEQAAFKLTFMPRESDSHHVTLLGGLADLVSHSASEYAHCLEDARDLRRTAAPTRSHLERFLRTVDRLADLEHRSDATVRVIEATLTGGDGEVRPPVVLLDVARALQQAIESLARCSLIARDYVFSTTSEGE
jgi:hypothetical protein